MDTLVSHDQLRPSIPQLIIQNIDAFGALQSFHDVKPRASRLQIMTTLRDEHSIDTSGEHWQNWANMGAK